MALPDSYIGKIWIPDIIFSNAKEGNVQSITDPNKVLKLNARKGAFLYAQRWVALLSDL